MQFNKTQSKDAAVLVAQPQPGTPDAYCITTSDGGCISTDPRCMHQPQAEAVPPGYVLVPVEPDEMWAHRVIRHHQPNLAVGTRDWCECLEEMLHWHAAIAQQKGGV